MPKNYDMIPGDQLSLALKNEALRAYSMRYTGEHVPDWSKKAAPNGSFYAPQYQNDAEWLSKTSFPVTTKQGELQLAQGNNIHCQSIQASFPWGQWLDTPFQKGTPLPSADQAPGLGN